MRSTPSQFSSLRDAYIEQVNRTYRTEILNAWVFTTLEEVRDLSEAWRQRYNTDRTHDSLGAIRLLTFLPRATSADLSHCQLRAWRGSLRNHGARCYRIKNHTALGNLTEVSPVVRERQIMSNGLVSIVVAFYNAERFLHETIESVISQTYTNWELLLVDDGSTDNGSSIAQSYAERSNGNIHYLPQPGNVNRGMCSARNLGVAHCKGDFVAILDSDDVWQPDKLEQQVALMRAYPDVGLVYGNSEYWYDWNTVDAERNENHIAESAPPGLVYYPPALLKMSDPLGPYGPPCPSDLLIRRQSIDVIGGFEEVFSGTNQLFEDLAFLSKAYLHIPVYVAGSCLTKYRIHGDSYCAIADKLGRTASGREFFLRWLHQYLHTSRVKDPVIWYAFWRCSRYYRYRRLTALARRVRALSSRLSAFLTLRAGPFS